MLKTSQYHTYIEPSLPGNSELNEMRSPFCKVCSSASVVTNFSLSLRHYKHHREALARRKMSSCRCTLQHIVHHTT